MLQKQQTPTGILVGGNCKEVYDKWLSISNMGGITEELRDLGAPEVFQFFHIKPDKYILFRAKHLVNSWLHFCDSWLGNKSKKQIWNIALNRAKKELDGFKEEQFIFQRNLDFLQEDSLTNQ